MRQTRNLFKRKLTGVRIPPSPLKTKPRTTNGFKAVGSLRNPIPIRVTDSGNGDANERLTSEQTFDFILRVPT